MIDWLYTFFANLIVWVGGAISLALLAAFFILVIVEIVDVFRETGTDEDPYDNESWR